jgi:hypothetical protein
METPDTRENLNRFRQLVLEDDKLLERLRATGDLESFVALTVQLGGEHGYALTPEQVRAAVQEQRRAWLQKWI